MNENDVCGLLNVSAGDFVAVTGSGGKTSIIHSLALALSDGGRVWITTTTKVSSAEKDFALPVMFTGPDSVPPRPPGIISIFYMSELPESGKLKGPSPEFVSSMLWRNGENTVLCEADGSRRLPLKNYEPWDRPLSGLETRHVVSVGLQALGEEAGALNVHRHGLRPFAGIVDKSMIMDLMYSPGGYMDVPLARHASVVFGGVDSQERLAAARELAAVHSRLYPDGRVLFRGPLFGNFNGYWRIVR